MALWKDENEMALGSGKMLPHNEEHVLYCGQKIEEANYAKQYLLMRSVGWRIEQTGPGRRQPARFYSSTWLWELFPLD
jgi:hypothetical protein